MAQTNNHTHDSTGVPLLFGPYMRFVRESRRLSVPDAARLCRLTTDALLNAEADTPKIQIGTVFKLIEGYRLPEMVVLFSLARSARNRTKSGAAPHSRGTLPK